MVVNSVKTICAKVKEFNQLDKEFRRTHNVKEYPLGYTGYGLRPRNAIWLLVTRCGIEYDKAYDLINELK